VATKAFLLDIARCIGCQACVVACKTGNELPEGKQYIRITEQTSGTFPNMASWIDNHRCYHCTKAACVGVCPTGALYKHEGMTRFDYDKCIGCGYCRDACPYGVPRVVNHHSFKCDGCAAVTDAGGRPWCVATCPTGALQYGDRGDILAEAQSRVEALKDRYPEAMVYGGDDVDGLGVILVLPNTPETLNLPSSPKPLLVGDAWRSDSPLAESGIGGLSVLFAAVAGVIARRNHVREAIQRETAKRVAAADADGNNGAGA